MKKMKLIGTKCEGNLRLWTTIPATRISVFASQTVNVHGNYQLEQWASEHGRLRHCVIGTFHSDAEREILNLVLANGGKAVWFRGCRLPFQYTDVHLQAFLDGRLLVVSCFNRKHHTEATARFCAHWAAMCTDHHAYWFGFKSDFLTPMCQKAFAWGKHVEIYED